MFIATLIQINIALAVFNLLPFYPLDGFRIVLGFLPYDLSQQWAQMSRFGLPIILFLAFTGILSKMIFGPVNWLIALLL